MIRIKAMSAWYDRQAPVLKQINFNLAKAESVALVGANGAGKSSFLAVLLGLLPYAGRVEVAGLTVKKENYREIRAKAGMLFQNPDDQILQGTVAEDIAFGPKNYGEKENEIKARAQKLLQQFGRPDLWEKETYKLSFGEKKLVALTGLLVMKPEVLLLDEPTSALDPRARIQFMEYLKELPLAKVIVTHDLDMVFHTCSRVVLLDHGSIVANGAPQDILTNKELLVSHGLELPLCCLHRF